MPCALFIYRYYYDLLRLSPLTTASISVIIIIENSTGNLIIRVLRSKRRDIQTDPPPGNKIKEGDVIEKIKESAVLV